MPIDSRPKDFVSRHAGSLSLVTIAMTGLAVFTLIGAPGRAIQQWKNSDGDVVAEMGSGGILETQGLTINGTPVNPGGGFGTGNVLTIGDSRYVNVSGDTMTGKLLISTGSTDALEVVGTASGRVLHANDQLRSSGSLVVEGASTLNGNVSMNALASFVGYSASPQLTAADTTTGMHFDGPGIVSFHNGGVQTMLLSSTNMVGIGTGSPETTLEVVGTSSGRILHAQDTLNSSGALAVDGTSFLNGTVRFTGLNCTGNTNGGALTAGADGTVTCTDDDGGGSSPWTDDGTTVRLSQATDNVGIGTTNATRKLTLSGSMAFVYANGSTGAIMSLNNTPAFLLSTPPAPEGNGSYYMTLSTGTASGGTVGDIEIRGGASQAEGYNGGNILIQSGDNETGNANYGASIYMAGALETGPGQMFISGGLSGGAGNPGAKVFIDGGTDEDGENQSPVVLQANGDAGHVGVGTIDPKATLSVIGTMSGSVLQVDTTGTIGTLVVPGNATFDTNTMFVDASANRVGILNTSPKATLGVNGTMSGTTLQVDGTGTIGVLSVGGNATFDTNTLFVDASNNRVGVLTTSPKAAFSVAGTASASTLVVNGTTGFRGLTYTWPSSHVSSGYLQNDGSGNLSWATVSAGGDEDVLCTRTSDVAGGTANNNPYDLDTCNINSSTLTAGSVLRKTWHFRRRNDNSSTHVVALKLGSTQLLSASYDTASYTITCKADAVVTIRTTGATGTAFAVMTILCSDGTKNKYATSDNSTPGSTVTVDTTGNPSLTVTGDESAFSALTETRIYQAITTQAKP